MKPIIMSGDEAIARGAYEAGCAVAAAYPGTPSTEILENMINYKSIDSKWASNEKVAMEIALGASIGGARALAAMKHVGLNVAADPLFTMGYAGVTGGLVVVTADDPGCHSSQNEQDNRLYAPLAKLALIEPSDSQECKDYMKAAFEISEQFDIPVLFRVTTRVCHSKGLVELNDAQKIEIIKYESKPNKYALLPGVARARHLDREKSLIELEKYANTSPLNRNERGTSNKVGVITSGISYQYAREVFGEEASYLKLGLTNPMPSDLISDFAKSVEKLYILEEGEPYIENTVKRLGFTCVGKEKIPLCGELSTELVRKSFFDQTAPETYTVDTIAPPRPPVLCAGCPHRAFFVSLTKLKKEIIAVGDIGCYALGINAPFNGFEYSICMGAGMSSIIGFASALKAQGDTRKVLGMVGDSTFFHSGLVGLNDVVHYNSNVIAVVLDNSITAMTGHQENPGTVKSLSGEPVKKLDLVTMIRATGIGDDRVVVVDPNDQPAMDAAFKAALAVEGPFVIVTKSPCILIKDVVKTYANKACQVDQVKCKKCKACLKIACPALSSKDGVISIDYTACTACGLCMQQCKFDAIERVGE